MHKRNYYNGPLSIDEWVIFNSLFYEFLSNTTWSLTPICHSCSFGSFSLTRLTRCCRPQLISILISLKDKHIYTDIYAYLDIYENVKVTLVRQLAMVILIRSSRPPTRCPGRRCPHAVHECPHAGYDSPTTFPIPHTTEIDPWLDRSHSHDQHDKVLQ